MSKATITFIQTLPVKLLGLAATFILLNACTDPAEVGLEIDPDRNKFGVFYTEIPLSASQVFLDSTNTTNTGTLIAGSYSDSDFGSIDASGFTNFGYALAKPTLDQETIYDSLVLELRVNSLFGNRTSAKDIQVFRLVEDISPLDSVIYFSRDQLASENISLGENTFNFETRVDTLITIKLEDDFGNDLFNKIKNNDPSVESDSTLKQYFKGIKISLNNNPESIITFLNSETRLILFYKDPTNSNDSATVIFNTARGKHFSQVLNDKSGSTFANVTESRQTYPPQNGLVASKSGIGLLAKVNFDNYFAFKDTVQNLVINRAEFAVGPVNTFTANTTPFPVGVLYYVNEQNEFLRDSLNGQFRSVQRDRSDPRGITAPAQIEFDNDDRLYSVSITDFLDFVNRGGLGEPNEIPELFIYPSNYQTRVSGFIVDENQIRLRIYYSKIR
ncbi:DUF4270 family protein [Penaeicola halotolerans]|uniref:DUF4270 family protein n=1 Tax=Penaeicola halotolerans TaxID=2793196 RepID=UPI001CF8BD3C|nr:DUF4270 family protein [Penaeicola halotolerans]